MVTKKKSINLNGFVKAFAAYWLPLIIAFGVIIFRYGILNAEVKDIRVEQNIIRDTMVDKKLVTTQNDRVLAGIKDLQIDMRELRQDMKQHIREK